MTAETLKPFITPTGVVNNNFPAKHSAGTHSQRKTKHAAPIVLGIIAAALVIGIFVLTIWQTVRVQHLESELNGLKKDVESLRHRLGINYLEEMDEFQNEYDHRLIDDPNNDELDTNDYDEDDDDLDDMDTNVEDDDDDDDDADDDQTVYNGAEEESSSSVEDDYVDYLDLINQETNGNHTKLPRNSAQTESSASTSSSSNDDNVFDDFTSYNDSKKKKERKSRSIANLRNELQSNEVTQNQNQTEAKTEQQLKENVASTESLPHHHSHKSHSRAHHRRHRVLVRKAKSVDNYSRPAAHFHLRDSLRHDQGHQSLQGLGYTGDIYVGEIAESMYNQQAFTVDKGVLMVHEPGLYYVYAQICYNNSFDENGYIIFHEHTPFLECLNTVPTNMPKVHTCHTSGLIQLERNEKIHLRDIHRQRNVIFRNRNNRSYFGIIKI
ncbi:protein eiger isoform X2 [Drosophila nasuta]|uniref:protein eiger isoform X2 n=1 Tax=Drosophila nasuta TaxID=42062 RepID=UPI00295E2C99|nr:protein eiger isoform X2 [Drosophila nasuta]